MVIKIKSNNKDFKKLSGFEPERKYSSFLGNSKIKYMCGGRLDKIDSETFVEEQMHLEENGKAFLWKRVVPKGMVREKSKDILFKIHWAIIDGDVLWYKDA